MNTSYDIGSSMISVGQRAMEIVGQNVANANTEGYHRQDVSLVTRVAGLNIGNGVSVGSVRRFTADSARLVLRQATGEAARLDARFSSQSQVETLLKPGNDGIDGRMEALFNQFTQLTTRPDDGAQRRVLVTQASGLAAAFRSTTTDLNNHRIETATLVNQTVTEINSYADRIAKFNGQILAAEAGGGQANDLRDQRDQLVNELSQRIDVRVTSQESGVVNIISAGVALVVGDQVDKLQVTAGPGGALAIKDSLTGDPAVPTTGKLSGLLEEANVHLPDVSARLDELAKTFIRELGTVQATGLGSTGPVTNLTGNFRIPDLAIPLGLQDLPIPPQAGNLSISITDQATGLRTLASLAIDPATQNLQDIANGFATATGGKVVGSINPATNTLQLQAQAGFTFDFAGRLPSVPNSAINGTSVPQVTGTFQGSTNDTYTFNVLGSGTIGTTAGLQLELRNGANQVLGTYDIGANYTPDSPINVGNGITVRLSAGTSANGTFSTPVTGKPDEAGILAALGVNGIFTGSSARDITVRSDLVDDPTKLSFSRSGVSGDSSNLQRFVALQDARVLSGGTLTLNNYAIDLATSSGTEAAALRDELTVQNNINTNLQADEQSIVGVDVNSEMLNLLRFQRMVEAGSKYLSVVNRALDSIIGIFN